MGSVPGSLTASSRSVPVGDAATLGSLSLQSPPQVPHLRPRVPKWAFTPGVHLRPAGPGDRGDPCVHKLAQVWGSIGRGPRRGASPGPAHRGLTGDTRTGHGELKLESGEWEAADKAISRALHGAPVSSSCSINLILGASLPPLADEEAARPSGQPCSNPFGTGQQWSPICGPQGAH